MGLEWLNAPVTSPFGDPDLLGGLRTKPSEHTDYGTQEGMQIGAVRSGVVVDKGFERRLGNYVVIQHADGTKTMLFHGKSVPVEIGQKVSRGETVMVSGNTGASTGPHTSLRAFDKSGKTVNPATYLQNIPAEEGGEELPTMAEDEKKKKASRTEGSRTGVPAIDELLARLQESGGLLDPTVREDVYGDPGKFAATLRPSIAARRALAKGGAPIFGGPSYLQDIADQIGAYAEIASILQGLTGFGGADGGAGLLGPNIEAGANAAFDPASLAGLFNSIVNASAQPDISGMMDALVPGGGASAAADALAKSQSAAEAGGAPQVSNIIDYLLRTPGVVENLIGMMTFGSGSLGRLMQSYFRDVAQPAYASFEREAYSGGNTNPLLFLLDLLRPGSTKARRSGGGGGGNSGGGAPSAEAAAATTAAASTGSGGGGGGGGGEAWEPESNYSAVQGAALPFMFDRAGGGGRGGFPFMQPAGSYGPVYDPQYDDQPNANPVGDLFDMLGKFFTTNNQVARGPDLGRIGRQR